jgi:hypothetical protein
VTLGQPRRGSACPREDESHDEAVRRLIRHGLGDALLSPGVNLMNLLRPQFTEKTDLGN